MSATIPPGHRPTALEWALLATGLLTFSGLGLLVFKVLPSSPELLAPGLVSSLLGRPWFGGALLLVALGLLSGGLATRATWGSGRATYVMALGNAVTLSLALLVYSSLAPAAP